jgi:hypothetical protein
VPSQGGTTTYAGYSRTYRVDFADKPSIVGSAAAAFRGDPVAKAAALHEQAHAGCFIANSVNFQVTNEPTVRAEGSAVPSFAR